MPVPNASPGKTHTLNLKRIQGPHGWPLLGVLPNLVKDPINFLLSESRKYEGIISLPVLKNVKLFLVTEPDHIRHILATHHRNYWKGPMLGRAKFLLGNGLSTSEGVFWQTQRKLIQPAFSHQKITGLSSDIISRISRSLENWQADAEKGNPLMIDREMLKLTMSVSAYSMFGENISTQESNELGLSLHLLQKHLNYRLFTFFLPEGFPLPGARKAAKILKRLDDMAYRIIRERREKPVEKEDLLTLLLNMRDEDTGEEMGDVQLRDEIITLFVAGYDTTSSGLSWAWYLLSQYPEVEAKFHQEIDEVLQGRTPELEDYPKLEYTRRVFQESLRLMPPVWIFFRTNFKEDQLNDQILPAGSPILLSPYITHRNPAYWDTPDEFNPDHFLPEKIKARPQYAYYPFGAGGRKCIGEGFSYLKAVFSLAMIGQKYKLTLAPGHKVIPHSAPGLQPKNGIKMHLEPRQSVI